MHDSEDIGAGFFAAIILAIALLIISLYQPSSALGCNQGLIHRANKTATCAVTSQRSVPSARHFSEEDEIAALEVVQVALSSVEDGVDFTQKWKDKRIQAVIRPTQSFKDNRGRVCRHVMIWLHSGTLAKAAEGIACRQRDGVWSLEG